MFCPKCSQAQPAEDLRFCPRCGFPLVAVKELLGREEESGDHRTGSGEEWSLPAQKDLATGALLMFVGALKATLLTTGMHPGTERGLTALAFVAGMLLLTLLLRPVLRAAHGLLFKGDKSADSPAPFND